MQIRELALVIQYDGLDPGLSGLRCQLYEGQTQLALQQDRKTAVCPQINDLKFSLRI